MVIVQFRGRLLRYRACVVDSLGLGIAYITVLCV